MTVVLMTDSTLMPDTKISIVKKERGEKDKDVVNEILNDLQRDMNNTLAVNKEGGKVKKTFVNSIITRAKVENPPDDFKLNLYTKPTIDIVSLQ